MTKNSVKQKMLSVTLGKIAMSGNLVAAADNASECGTDHHISLNSSMPSVSSLSSPKGTENEYLLSAQVEGKILYITVAGIRADKPMDVWIGISSYLEEPKSWPPSCSGQTQLGKENLEVVAGITVAASQFQQGGTVLGESMSPSYTVSVTVPVKLSDLSESHLLNNKIYMQALAIPFRTMDFAESQASEVDTFEILPYPDVSDCTHYVGKFVGWECN
jgi:hypothetical protein